VLWARRHGGVLGEWWYYPTHSLTSALDGGEWSASRPGRFTPPGRHPGMHWVGGWWAPQPVSMRWRREKCLPLPGMQARSSSPWPSHYTDWATLNPAVLGTIWHRMSACWCLSVWQLTNPALSWSQDASLAVCSYLPSVCSLEYANLPSDLIHKGPAKTQHDLSFVCVMCIQSTAPSFE